MLGPGRRIQTAPGLHRIGLAGSNVLIQGILNISLIEASIKVLTRWYYVPARLSVIFPGTSPLCFRGCELEGSMIYTWWTCPHIRSFWQKVFCTVSIITKKVIAPNPNIALLNGKIEALPKFRQTLVYFILLGAKVTITKAWKKPNVSFLGFKRKVSWTMAQEQIVAKLNDKSGNFYDTWEPWAIYCNIPLLLGMSQVSKRAQTPQ